MATQTLHSDSPCPGKGATVTTTEISQSIVSTVKGVGAIRAVYQLWVRIDGAPEGKLGAPRVVTGTVSYDEEEETDVFVEDTNTVSTPGTELRAELMDITLGATFSCTQTDVAPE